MNVDVSVIEKVVRRVMEEVESQEESATDNCYGVFDTMDQAIEAEQGNRHTAMMHSKNVDKLTKMAKLIHTTIFVKNGPSYAGIGVGGEGYTTFTIAGPTGEGLTSAKSFARKRRCVLVGGFHIK